MQGFELGLQPGLNVNIDSFQIQNNSQSLENSHYLEKNNSSTNSISFMDLVQSEIHKSESFEKKSEVQTEVVQNDSTDASKKYSDKEVASISKEAADKDVKNANANEKSKLDDEKNLSEKNEFQNENSIFALSKSKDQNQIKDKKIDNAKVNLQKQNKDLIQNFDEKNVLTNNLITEKNDLSKLNLSEEKIALLNTETNVDKTSLSNLSVDKSFDESNLKKLSYIKKNDKKLNSVISVTDLRTDKKVTDVSKVSKKTDFVTSVKQTSNDTVQLTMDLTNSAQKNILSLDNQNAASIGSNFQAMLENQISENASDFVKAGNIILKDNNSGKINLVLHPESLGNVKISLDLSDKVITGKIIVSSQEAFKAFNSTQENLRNAFIENGFENASFELSFANQNQNFSSGQQSQQHYSAQVEKAYNNFSVENVTVDENNSDIKTELQNYSINFVA